MKIEYDAEADALYIRFREVAAADNVDIEEGVSVDVDADNHIIGLEILDASVRMSPSELGNVSIEGLPPQ